MEDRDGGLYIAGPAATALPPHAWIRMANIWLLRAAEIQFPDGTTHLTPGYPTHYDGQWMRDSFYGISGGWGLVNATTQARWRASAEWMFSRSRSDGVMPQACPPRGPLYLRAVLQRHRRGSRLARMPRSRLGSLCD